MADAVVEFQAAFLERLGSEHGQTLFDFVSDVQFWIKDGKHRYVHVNHGFLQNYALPGVDRIVGKTDYELSPNYLAARFHEDDTLVMETGESIVKRVELVGRFDGTMGWYATTKIPLRDRGGTIIGTSGITCELADRRASQAMYGEMGEVIEFVRDNMDRTITVTELAKIAHMSVSALERNFKKRFNMTPLQYVKRLRINLACELLMTTDRQISDVALDCGFCDHSYMTKEFGKHLGMTPKEYRNAY